VCTIHSEVVYWFKDAMRINLLEANKNLTLRNRSHAATTRTVRPRASQMQTDKRLRLGCPAIGRQMLSLVRKTVDTEISLVLCFVNYSMCI